MRCENCSHLKEQHSSNGRCMVQVILTEGKTRRTIRDIKEKHLCDCREFVLVSDGEVAE